MAAGDSTFFNQFKVDLGNKIMDLDTDVYKVGLITNAVTPTAGTAGPHWGGTGTTNFATNEATPGGNYAAGGPTLASLAYDATSWRAGKVSIAQNAGNPTNARWAIIYNNTDTNKRAIAFIDLGAVIDLTAGPFEIRFNSVDGTGEIASW